MNVMLYGAHKRRNRQRNFDCFTSTPVRSRFIHCALIPPSSATFFSVPFVVTQLSLPSYHMYSLPTQSRSHINPPSHPSSPLPAAFPSSPSLLRDVGDEQMIWEPIVPVRDANQTSYNADFVISAQETRQMHYLALDTNILINYLNTVRTLHTLLSASVDRLGLLILIPIKVIQG